MEKFYLVSTKSAPYLLLLLLISPALARAANEGQDALDQATEKKIAAESLNDLTEVIELCDKALKQGLDDTNTQFANSLLGGTLVQRGTALSAAIFDRTPPDPRWPQLRALAIKDLERAIVIDSKTGEAHYLIGRLHSLPAGDRDRARKAAEQAVELTKKDRISQGKSLVLRANLSDDAAQRKTDYDAAIKLSPDDDESLRSRGLFLMLSGKFADAVSDFDAAIKLEPADSTTYEARGIAQMMLKNYDDAKASLDKAIELSPNAPLPYMHRGRVLADQKKFKEAIDDLTKSVKLDPDNVAAILFRARVHQINNDAKAAREDVELALKSRPGMTAALEMRAIISAGSGDFDSAVTDFEDLAKVAPKNAELQMQIGILHAAAKRPRKAIEKFTTALELGPSAASGDTTTKEPATKEPADKESSAKDDATLFTARRARADAYLSVGKHAEAVADFEIAYKQKPNDAGVLNNFAWVLCTSPDDKVRDGKRAIELALKGCKLTDNKQAHILSTLAAAYAETGDWDEAIKWSKKANEVTDDKNREQIKQELTSYENKKPWRELQNEEDAK